MAHSEVCPVCKGEGKVCKGVDEKSTSAIPILAICHGCNGRGWVEVGNDKSYYPIPYTPSYYPTGTTWIYK